MTVPSVTASVGVARRAVIEALHPAGADADTVDTAGLLVSEVVTNAILHARTEVSVSVHVGRGVLIEVTDGGAVLPRPRSHGEESITGRGLDLVQVLATGFGAYPSGDGGKVVWFTLGAASPPAAVVGWQEPSDAVRVGVLPGLPVSFGRCGVGP